ncbi:MAG: oligosaccharide flippase family protein [Candidatus Kapaibacterium sp.]
MALPNGWNKLSEITSRLQGRNSRQILENFLSLSTVQVLGYVFPLILLPYLIRTLGTEKYGLTETASSFLGIFLLLTNYGFSYSSSRQISIHRADSSKVGEVYSAVMVLKSIFMLLTFCIVLGLTYSFPKFERERPLYLWSFGAIIGDVLFPIWLFQGLEKMRYISLLNITARAIVLGLTLLFVQQEADYIYVPIINSTGLIVIGLSSIVIARRKLEVYFRMPTMDEMRLQLAEGWNTFVSGVSINLYTQARVFIFSLFASETITGYYSVAQRVTGIFQVFPLMTLLNAVLPRLNHLYSVNRAHAVGMLRTFQRYASYYTAVMLIGCLTMAPWIIHLISGKSNPEIISTFRLLISGAAVANFNIFRVHYFIISGNFKLFSTLHSSASIVGIILMLVLTYTYLHIGMAIAILLLEIGILIATYVLTRQHFILESES